MENMLQQFQNEEFGAIRALEIAGQPWFFGKDVAGALGYTNGSRDVNRHVDAEDRRNEMIPQYQNGTLVSKATLINESGLYSLILSSKLPKAKVFKRWVTSEILPCLRKHGAYMTDALLTEVMRSQDAAIELFGKLRDEMDKTAALRDRVDALTPKARYYDAILQNKGVVRSAWSPRTTACRRWPLTACSMTRVFSTKSGKRGCCIRSIPAWAIPSPEPTLSTIIHRLHRRVAGDGQGPSSLWQHRRHRHLWHQPEKRL